MRHNAQTIHDLNEEQGSFVNYVATWPSDQIVDFWEILKRRFKQLGGESAAYFLRRIRKDTFFLTTDVINAMLRWGALDSVPQNKRQRQQAQSCMNEWQAEGQRPYCQISKILALSID